MLSNAKSAAALTVVALTVIAAIGVTGGLSASAVAQSGYNRSKVQPESHSDKPSDNTGKSADVLKLNSTVVSVAAVVTDHSGQYVPKLTKDDFLLYENGAPQQVAFFTNEEVRLNLALLVDVSQSVSSSLKDIKKAANQFVQQLRPEDRIMVVAFDQQVMYLTDFTNDRKRLESAINGCQTGRGTSVYEAVYDTVATRFHGVEGRKAILLLSDGEDTTSRNVTYDQTIDRVAQSDVLVYGIRYPDTGHGHWQRGGPYGGHRWPFVAEAGEGSGISDADQFSAASAFLSNNAGQWGQPGQRGQQGPYGHHRRDQWRDFMKDVTEAGGGPVYDAKSIGDLAKLAPKVADELRHVYMVGYYPTKPLSDGGYRTIDVKIKGHDDLSVRHRQGYNASPSAPQTAS